MDGSRIILIAQQLFIVSAQRVYWRICLAKEGKEEPVKKSKDPPNELQL